MLTNRAFVLLLLAACGGREGRAPVSRPSPASPASPAVVAAPEFERPIGYDVKESDVVVTGGFGAAKDRFIRAGDPKPGDSVEVVRFTCDAKTCAPLERVSTSPFSAPFEERLRECFTVKSRAGTAGETAQVSKAMNSGSFVVPAGRIFVVERRRTRQEEVLEALECPKDTRHPCDPAMIKTGRFVEKTDIDLVAMAARGSDVSVPFRTWTLRFVHLTRMPGPLETVDVSTEPAAVRASILFDRAVEAVRSKDRARIAAAVKAVEAGVSIADGTRIEDQAVPRSVADAIVLDLPIIRAVAEGRASIGDACKR